MHVVHDAAKLERDRGAGDTLNIAPPHEFRATEIDTYDDHRMAMAFAVVGTRANGIAPVGISWAVQKGDASLLAKLNAFLKNETANGDIARLKQKYLTPQGFAKSVGLK